MNKYELRTKHATYERLMAYRLRAERAIIEALPHKLEVLRTVAPKRIEQTGGIEIEADSYGDALALAERFRTLAPLPLTQVTAWRTPGHKTVSFIPSCLVPVRWHNDPQNASIGEVYPVLYQLAPGDDPLCPKVYLEWFAELAPNVVANVRVFVKHHPVMWVRQDQHFGPVRFKWPGAPQADCERVLKMKQGQPPFVTLWWHKGCDYFTFALLGDGREVARG